MFSISPKRSVMTLAVIAGLLATAGPASAGPPTSEVFELNTLVRPASGKSPQRTQVSLGRENSIECLVRAKASGKGQTKSRKPVPLNITLCHEGFEIR